MDYMIASAWRHIYTASTAYLRQPTNSCCLDQGLSHFSSYIELLGMIRLDTRVATFILHSMVEDRGNLGR